MSEHHSGRPDQSPWAWIWTTPWLFGLLVTVGFYFALERIPGSQREMMERYFCNHPTEYCEAGLFFIGLTDLLLKTLFFRRERASLAAISRESLMTDPPAEAQRAEAILERCRSLPAFASTIWFRRLRDLALEASTPGSSSALEEHLKVLAEKADDDLHESYSLIATITWAIPIMGFLGTVLGITIAIAYITPEQLDKSLNQVTGGLAIAFDTTAVALVMSLVLVFAQRGVRSRQSAHLNTVAASARMVAIRLFPQIETQRPWHQAEGQAAIALIDRTDELINQQTRLWGDSIEKLRLNWSETIDTHRNQLSTSLVDGTDQTWVEHREQLAALRNEFVSSYRDVSNQLAESVAKSNAERVQNEQTLREQTEAFWATFREDWSASQAARDAGAAALVEGIGVRLDEWQERMGAITVAAEAQMNLLREHTAILLRIVDQEEHLVGLERRLTGNLEAVRAAETFEQTLHSLNAAIHMLTARQSTRAA